jgi:hypothetical protein
MPKEKDEGNEDNGCKNCQYGISNGSVDSENEMYLFNLIDHSIVRPELL